jgi:hypothetical protein
MMLPLEIEMGAAFREVWSDFGVEEVPSSGNAKIIVPLNKGGNIIALVDAKGLQPVPERKGLGKIKLTEFPVSEMSKRIGQLPRKPAASARALGTDVRYFFVTATQKSGGSTGILVKAGSAELYVNVLEQRVLNVAIRHVAGRNPDGNHSKIKADFDALVDEMNAIWLAQANVLVKRVDAPRAQIDRKKIQRILGKDFDHELPDNVDIKKYGAVFEPEIVSGADLTFFLLNQTSDGPADTAAYRGDRDRVRGVIRRDKKFALISDLRSSSTMAHEAGHFRGSGHVDSKTFDLLMREGGAGTKITYDEALTLNGKY